MVRKLIRKTSMVLLIAFISILAFCSLIYYMIPSEVTVFGSRSKTLELPIKSITISAVPSEKLIIGGHSVGVKMDVKGVLIVGLEEIRGKNGEVINPGIMAGLQIGDNVLAINGIDVDSAEDVIQLMSKAGSDPLELRIQRRDEIINITITPAFSQETNSYKLGLWVKEKTAGIGTLTYYNPKTEIVAALGHGITDPETGTIYEVANGQLLYSKVQSIKQGKAGEPGEIRGIFYEADEPMGALLKNTEFGIFGESKRPITNPFYPEPVEIGLQQDVKKGKAYILTTLENDKMEQYEVEIEKIYKQSKPSTKSMIIRVTDERLLEKSGGIVQGMSGSPIVQDGKLIGAVTHVFVNNPKKGYGIFIEWMLHAEQ